MTLRKAKMLALEHLPGIYPLLMKSSTTSEVRHSGVQANKSDKSKMTIFEQCGRLSAPWVFFVSCPEQAQR